MPALGGLFARHTGRHVAGRPVPPRPAGPVVELSFGDGSTLRLPPDSPQGRAMLAAAASMISTGRR